MGGVQISKHQRGHLLRKHKISIEEFQELLDLFKKHSNYKGQLMFKGFRQFYIGSEWNHSKRELEEIFNAFDRDGSGFLDFPEFVRLMCMTRKVGDMEIQEKIRILFDVMDTDGGGTISEFEFKNFISHFAESKKDVKKLFQSIDLDESHEVEYKEFKKFCKKHPTIFERLCSYMFPRKDSNAQLNWDEESVLSNHKHKINTKNSNGTKEQHENVTH